MSETAKPQTDDWLQIAEILRASDRVTVLTGAGVSAASGVPTFRGTGGLWKNRRPEQLATPEAFGADPVRVWEWYQWRRQRIARCQPNRAHGVIAEWSRRFPEFTLITQNVDGLHERAGTEAIVRFHGSVWDVSCVQRCPDSPESWWDDTEEFSILPPRCPYCGGILRPAVVWFGESIPEAALAASERALDCDAFLTVGTSSVVYPAAALASAARDRGARTVEINLEPTPVSDHFDVSVIGQAEVVLDGVNALL